jgi:transposase
VSVGVETLFTSALGLVAPWEVAKVDLDTAKRRIDFEVRCNAKLLTCPHCNTPAQGIHDRLRRSWRHLMALPDAAISYDRFHVIKMAIEAMDEVRRTEWREHPQAVHEALGGTDRKVLKGLMWGMRKNPPAWSGQQTRAMHWLQHSTLKSARAWRLKMALREVYAAALKHNDLRQAERDLRAWLSWARRSRLEPFKKLAKTLATHLAGVISGMVDNRSNAFVEAMNGLLQQAKRAARGFRTASNFIAIAYLRMSKLSHLPHHPFIPASPQ